MADNERRAFQLVADAERKLSAPKGFFRSLFGGDASRADEALECYVRAANLFKMSKNWEQAAAAFTAAARLYAREGRRHDEASSYVDAAKCWNRCDPREGVAALGRAVAVYLAMGRFALAARHEESAAAAFEAQLADPERALRHYELAADYYAADGADATANRCRLKVAQLSAQAGDHSRAASLYEAAAESALASTLVRFSAREYLFRAGACLLAADALALCRALERYGALCPAFADSRECKLLRALAAHVDDHDPDAFAAAVAKYDNVSRLDAWLAAILLLVKDRIGDEPDLR